MSLCSANLMSEAISVRRRWSEEGCHVTGNLAAAEAPNPTGAFWAKWIDVVEERPHLRLRSHRRCPTLRDWEDTWVFYDRRFNLPYAPSVLRFMRNGRRRGAETESKVSLRKWVINPWDSTRPAALP